MIDLTGVPSSWADTRTYRSSLEAQYDLGRQRVATLGYQGTASRDLTRQYNLNVFLGTQGIAFNPVVQHVDWYDEGASVNFNVLLAEVRHQFSQSFQLNAQYRWSSSLSTADNNYDNGNYQFTLNQDYGKSDANATNAFKMFGIWSSTIFHGSRSWIKKIAGGWKISRIWNWYSGFPYNSLYNDGLLDLFVCRFVDFDRSKNKFCGNTQSGCQENPGSQESQGGMKLHSAA